MQPNAMFEMGLEDTHAPPIEKNKITVPDMVSDREYYELVNSLNTKQHDHLMHVLNAFKLRDLPLYHFVSGEAGVGKSRLIKALYQSLMRHFNREPGPVDTPEILITAYTGKAAHNVNGLTAHAAFSLIMVEPGNKKSDSISPEALNTLRVKLKNLKLIIIDEISMMGISTFEKINRRLMQVFQSKKEFGGVSVITFGDFQQLRPVQDNYIFASAKNIVDGLFGNPLWDKFKHFELTEIMRQRDDLTFAQLLGRLAKGALTQCDIDLIKSRIFVEHPHQLKPGDRLLPEEGKKSCRLMWRNEDVEEHNIRRIQELRGPNSTAITYRAVDKITGASSEVEKRQVRHNLQNLSYRQTQGLPSELVLQTGVKYMITTNIDVADGLYNGGVGELMFMEFRGGKLYCALA
jgi:nucleoside-triphosphatase THEP1